MTLTRLFLLFWEASLGAGAVILILGVLSSRINLRYAARWKYWVWLVLAARLVLPVPVRLPAASVAVALPPAVSAPLLPAGAVGAALPGAAAVPGVPAAPAEAVSAAASGFALSPLWLAAALWLAGAVLFFAWQLGGYFHFRRSLLRWGRPEDDPALLARLELSQARLGLSGRVLLLRCPRAAGPMMLGFFKPILVLPPLEFPAQDLDFIFAHELTHWRRRDVWYKLFLLLALSLHWFNPAVHWMNRLAGDDLEISCDSAVTAGFTPAQRRAYSETILKVVHRQSGCPTGLSTCFKGSTASLKERFSVILSKRPLKQGRLAFVCALAAALFAVGLVSCGISPAGPASAPSAPSADGVASSAPESEAPIPEGWQYHTVTFDGLDPVYFTDFTATFPLPAGLTVGNIQHAPYSATFHPVFFHIYDESGEVIGQVSHAAFSWYPEVNDYRAIYSGVMLGSMVNWDNEFSIAAGAQRYEADRLSAADAQGAIPSGILGAAVCRPAFRTDLENHPGAAAAAPLEYRQGVLAHNSDLLTILIITLPDGYLPQSQLNDLAAGIILEPVTVPAPEMIPVEDAFELLNDRLKDSGLLSPGISGKCDYCDPNGEPLVWYKDQMYVGRLNGERALIVEMDYHPEAEVPSLYGFFGILLGDGSLYYRAPETGNWTPVLENRGWLPGHTALPG